MAEAFDPYLRWLGIRDPDRPPSHYRLLGLHLFENDPDVIAVAADRQMAHVRTFQTGQYAEASQRLLNELASARVCLLKVERKKVYDEQLRRRINAQQPAAATRTPAVAAAENRRGLSPFVESAEQNPPRRTPAGGTRIASDSTPSPLDLDLPDCESTRVTQTVRKPVRKANPGKNLWLVAGLPLGALAVAVGIAIYVANSGDSAAPGGDSRSVAATDPQAAKTGTNQDRGNAGATSDPGKRSGTTIPDKANPDKSPSNLPPLAPHPSPPVPSPQPSVPSAHPSPIVTPPLPPVQSPHDVLRVDNPTQPVAPDSGSAPDTSHHVVTVDPGKPGFDVPGNTGPHENPEHDHPDHGHPEQGGPKNPVAPADGGNNSKSKRAPVPSKEQIAAADVKIQRLFNVAAAKKPDERAALAKTLYDQGVDPNNQEVDRYVLLHAAMKDAAALGDADLALKAVDKLTDTFDVNTLEEKLGVLTTLGKMVRAPLAANALAGTVANLLEEVLDADDFESAKSLVQLGAGFATKAGNPSQAKEFRQRAIELDQIKKEYAAAAPARDTLQSKPDDPEANFVWGYYLGPIKGDFDKALPFLAKSNNDSVQSLAKKELDRPTDASAQAELADGWCALAEKSKPSERANIQSHAEVWYGRALPNLKGIAHTEVEQKLAQIDSERKRSGGRDRAEQLTRILTSGQWRIEWKTATAWNLTFFADHTVTGQGTGTWAVEQGVVQLHWKERPSWRQTIRIVKDHLEVEIYIDGVLSYTGIGRPAIQ